MSTTKSVTVILGLLVVVPHLACGNRKSDIVRHAGTLSPDKSDAVTVWPVPTNASRTSHGLRYVVLRRGRNSSRPATYAVAYRYTSYDTRGSVVGPPRDVVQSPTATKEWADIFETMMPGEVRRVWVQPEGTVKIYDIELHGFVVLEDGK
jgi:hypothetical protein